jgi:hypothetical protein
LSGSLHERSQAGDPTGSILSDWPIARPSDRVERANAPLSARERKRLRRSLDRGRPFGDDGWADGMAMRLGIEHTLRPEGRPPKKNELRPRLGSPRIKSGPEIPRADALRTIGRMRN